MQQQQQMAPAPRPVRREDYSPPAFWIDSVDLTFDLDPDKTRVLNRMTLRRNPQVPAAPLTLDGEDLNLARVLVNGQSSAFKIEGQRLVLANLPGMDAAADALAAPFELEILSTCCPAKNTRLMGLYLSEGTFFTQCEAEGFRRISYFLDRPDVMASYSVTLRAERAQYPVLLSNGNLVETRALDNGRHQARWVDPHRKPCYLFALVAGKLVTREQRIRSRSGREHLLQVHVRPGDLGKTGHALDALVHSVAWDEARFGLALDLERFMIVATSDFNMGAMENKGLNIFNSKYVLASEATATDADFFDIERVVGHEYFHNWSGNRVTCRDWFQLSLKEGLTVFRDQEFSQDLAGSASARAVRRIADVRLLRSAQFPEDAGPMAHPVRPDSYQEINNFYTVTVYEKGAELVRMMHTLVGRAGFARGLRLYFERHDGQAVTCDCFAQAIADANAHSALAQRLAQFKRWYSQAGTPRLHAAGSYDAATRSYTLSFTQSCPATPGQPDKLPFVIPVELGLLSADGAPLALHIESAGAADLAAPTPDAAAAQPDAAAAQAPATSRLVVLHAASHTLRFGNLDSAPVPSLLRNFSAPVLLEMDYSDAQLQTLLAHDSDAFNRWEAGQRLALRIAIKNIANTATTGTSAESDAPILNPGFCAAMRAVLRHPGLDPAFKELVLTLPAQNWIAEQLAVVDPQRIHAVREAMNEELALALHADWVWTWEQHQQSGAYSPDAASAGRRALAGLALRMLCLAARRTGDAVWPGKAWQRFKTAANMTERWNALTALVRADSALAAPALARFHELFRNEPLVLDKWFALQAGAPDRGGNVLPAVRQLMQHPDFNLKNPNRARSLIFSYCNANPGAFHRADAAGYVFWSECVTELDAFNPQVAARLARALERWRKLAEPWRSAAREAIARIAARPELSGDLHEVLACTLAGPPPGQATAGASGS